MELSLIDHIFFVLIAVVVPLISIKQSKQIPDDITWDAPTKSHLYFLNSIILWLGATMAVVIWFTSRREMSLLGLSLPTLSTKVILLIGLFIFLYLLDILWKLSTAERKETVRRKMEKHTPFMPANIGEFKHFIVLAFSAAICEEIVFRGYLINYLIMFLGTSPPGVAIAIILPAISFGIGHMYQGLFAVFKVFIGGLLFGLIFYLSHSLLLIILLHFLIDLFSGWISMKYFDRAGS